MLFTLPLLARTQIETVDVMLQAAETRLREAEILLKHEQWDGTIYLAGYVAEMVMKVAFCKVDPAFPVNGSVDSAFGPAETLWRSLFPGIRLPRQYKHNLLFWETVFIAQCSASGKGLIDWGTALLMSKQLSTIGRHWQVDLRYQAPLAVPEEAVEVCEAAQWLFNNNPSLWS